MDNGLSTNLNEDYLLLYIIHYPLYIIHFLRIRIAQT